MDRRHSPQEAHPHRVLHVLTHLVYGGAEFYVLRLISCLDEDYFASFVCYLGHRSELWAAYSEAGVEPIAISHRGLLTAPRTLWRIVKLIRRLDIDIVQTHGRMDRLYGQLAAWFTRTPVVDTLHSEYAANRYSSDRAGRKGRLVARLRLSLEDWIRRRIVKALIGVSEHVADTWKELGSQFDRSSTPITLVSAPLDPALYGRFDPSTSQATLSALGLDNRDPVLITVGRLVQGKNHEMLLTFVEGLASAHPHIALLIVGAGPERGNLEDAIRGKGLDNRVYLLGQRDDVPALLASADVFLFPSVSEGMPLAVLEAVAVGLPIVAFDLPVFRHLISNGTNGYKARIGDPDDFAACARRVLAELGSLRASAAQQREALSEYFDANAISAALDSVYLEARGYS